MDRTNGALDAAVIAYREEPTEQNRARLMAAQSQHFAHFMAEQTTDYMERTS